MSLKDKKQKREFWGKKHNKLPKLELLRVQKQSYRKFLEKDIDRILKKVFPIDDFTGKNWTLGIDKYYFGEPKYTPEETLEKGLTYEVSVKTHAWLLNKQTKEKVEEEVFLGDLPKMTENGTFIINGIERAVVNQLVRSPGIFYSGELDPSTNRMFYKGELRPLRGSWLEFVVSKSDALVIKIDRRRKLPATIFLRATGLETDEQIIKAFEDVDDNSEHQYIASTFEKDPAKNQEEALIEFYKKMRPAEPAVLENARQLFKNMFFNPRRYDLGSVGRFKLNKRLEVEIDEEITILNPQDIRGAISHLINLQNGRGKVDDIDHLANRRIRRVGELVLADAFRPGLMRLERSIKEKMSLAKPDSLVTPSRLINPRPMIAVINDFFRRNRLSTILDQTNPLSELDNLRRLSVMGRGGVTKERASFSMRDINSSQYGRICPVRSPEGPNIGLVTYMALYAQINDYGFLETPYRKVKKVKKGNQVKMKVTDEIVYLSADDEENYYITHAEVEVDKNGYITDSWVPVRYKGEFKEGPAKQVQLIDTVSRQVVGASASLIPFLSHDESNRALMGTHMQCQAVPLIKPSSPYVGTGMEEVIPRAINWVVDADFSGKVVYVDANKITIKVNKSQLSKLKKKKKDLNSEFIEIKGDRISYFLQKFKRTSQSTCYSQKPLVKIGEKVKQGQAIIDGPACQNGELALGQNLLIAYAFFEGLGYEDAIIISDKLVKEDLLTSIYINEYVAEVMDTKLGEEELTRDIPNVSETDLANLADDGIVVVGSEVEPNDILVGKIAPKGETELTAEERLLRAIFGEKARDVRDTSLRMPHGERGTVIGVTILDREKGDELDPGVIKQVKVKVAQLRKIVVGDKLAGRHGNKGVISKIVPAADMPYLEDGTPVDIIISPLSVLARMNLGQLLETHLGWAVKHLGKKVAVPVFEDLDEGKIRDQLKKAELPIDGKTRLFDGRTGTPFKEKTVVGINYILKLIHMVEDKAHARSTGPYSLVTQQPLGGKAQMGGQRLGEMEVWALEAHRAAYTLQEMLTIKSDDVVGRGKAFEAIVKGVDIPEATVPESFKVLVKELNSLCLDVIPKGVIEEEEKGKPLVLESKGDKDNDGGPSKKKTKKSKKKTKEKKSVESKMKEKTKEKEKDEG